MDTESPQPARVAPLELFLRIAAAVGLGASSLLLWDYTRPEPTFCGVGGGCDLVRQHWLANPFGIPLPLFGVAFYLVVLVLSLATNEWARSALATIGTLGGVAGVGFILVQAFWIHAFCPYCMMTDGAAFIVAGLVWLRESPPVMDGRAWGTFALLTILGSGGPLAFGMATKPNHEPAPRGIPDCVKAGQAQGMVTITEFFDLQCPHCRNEHFTLSQLLATLGEPVRVVRRHFPLPGHKQAAGAARAAVCAEEAGFESVMMDMLFSADDLGEEKLVGFAEQLGMDTGAFRACLASAATARRLEDDHACGIEAGVEALPTIFIGQERFEGFKSPEALRAAIARAKAALQSSQPAQGGTLGPQAGQQP